MKTRLLLVTMFSFAFISCNNVPPGIVKTKVAIQPFEDFPTDIIKEVQAGIDSMYDIESTILPHIKLPKQAYYKPRNRYRADSLIRFLKAEKPGQYNKILGLTTSDISTTKGGYEDFGIMGLGFQPGKSCVASTYRVKRGAVSKQHLINRIRKVTIHELGHNFGLKHCTYDSKCLMQSAKGKVSTIDKAQEILCQNCQRQIRPFLR